MSNDEIDQFPDLPEANKDTFQLPPYVTEPDSQSAWPQPIELMGMIFLALGTFAALGGAFDRRSPGATLSSKAEKENRQREIEAAIEAENKSVSDEVNSSSDDETR